MKEIHRHILEHIRSGNTVALATVVRSSGSTPQKPGSSALFDEKELVAGTVGGGLLEGEVTRIATHVLTSGITDWYHFNLDSEQGEDGAICGGEALVLVDAAPAVHLDTFTAMEKSLLQRKPGTLVTLVGQLSDEGRSIRTTWIQRGQSPRLPADLHPRTLERISGILSDSSAVGYSEVELEPEDRTHTAMVFLEHVTPLPRLVIAGAGHIGAALAHLGSLLDFEVTVIDDRAEFANRENIPDADHILVSSIGKAVNRLEITRDTYIVIVTRGHTYDSDALQACIGSDAAYIGMIGSRHKVKTVRTRFLQEDLSTEEQWNRVHAPIGLDIGSQSVQEIAVSIAAELIRVRSKNTSHGT